MGYEDVNDWWRGKGTCINGSWRKFYKALANQAKKTAKINGDSSSEKPAENISVSAEPSKKIRRRRRNETCFVALGLKLVHLYLFSVMTKLLGHFSTLDG